MPLTIDSRSSDRTVSQEKFFRHPFLTKNLIAYIGNKRRLLPLIDKAVQRTGLRAEKGGLFVDLFAGSGAVARLAKLRGWRVTANDWEEYARVLGEGFLTVNRSELNEMFVEEGGLEKLLQKLNSLEVPKKTKGYISEYYAPARTECADPDRERMFYTRENGLRIDAIREWIEERYPGVLSDPLRKKEKNLLLALLLYGAATHANTSGVFKAYHRGFGGRGKDALGRIMKRIELTVPPLIDGNGKMLRMDAAEAAEQLAAAEEADIVYLDPPYNQHQYGSNYHLLNTIALNDRPEVPLNIVQNGKTVCKGGIRPDWVATRSEYCYKSKAESEFESLIGKIRTKWLLVSYSTEGIIPFRSLLEILAKRGRLDIVLSEYTRYRGGKQALTTTTRNLEFVLLVDCSKQNREHDTERILNILGSKKLEMFLKRPVSPAVFVEQGFRVSGFTELGRDLCFEKELNGSGGQGEPLNSLPVRMSFEIENFKSIKGCRFYCGNRQIEPGSLNGSGFTAVVKELEQLTAVSREEELSVAMSRIRYLMDTGRPEAAAAVFPELPGLLRKFNDRKAHLKGLQYLEEIARLYARLLNTRNDIDKKSGEIKRFLQRFERVAQLKLTARLYKDVDRQYIVAARRVCLSEIRRATGLNLELPDSGSLQ